MNQTFAPTRAGRLFDALMAEKQIKNDAALSRLLGVKPPVISKMRNGSLFVGPSLLLAMHEKCDWPVKTLRE